MDGTQLRLPRIFGVLKRVGVVAAVTWGCWTVELAALAQTPEPVLIHRELEEQTLLQLLGEEQKLLTWCGPDHPELKAVRARIEQLRIMLARPPAPQVVHTAPPPL